MTGSKRLTSFGYFFHFDTPASFRNIWGKNLNKLTYFFLPEDTTERVERWHSKVVCHGRLSSTIKVLFWVGVAIAISLVLGA